MRMEDLRRVYADLGFEEVETLLQSGNVVFRSDGLTSLELESMLQDETAKRLGITGSTMVRASAEWLDVIEQNPFLEAVAVDPSHVLVHFMNAAPLAFDVGRVQGAIAGPEEIRIGRKHLYVFYPNGIGTSTIARTPGWNRLTSGSTARNWNTILKLNSLIRE